VTVSTDMHGRPEERNGIGVCQSMEGNVVVYIHHGAVLLPVLLPVLFHLSFHHGVTPAIAFTADRPRS
jgi:hypothetical protein